MGILPVELPALYESRPDRLLQLPVGDSRTLCKFRARKVVQIPTEALELHGEPDKKRCIELGSPPTTTPTSTPHQPMRVAELLKTIPALSSPNSSAAEDMQEP